MNILLLTYQGDIAGSTLSITYLARGLAARGHAVYVGCRKESLLAGYFDDSSVQVLPMEFRSKWDLANARAIAKACQDYSIDIVNAQSSYDRYTSIIARLFMGMKARLVFTRRQVSRSMGGLQSVLYQKCTDQIVAVSQGVRESIMRDGISDSHITVIRNGTPADKYARLRPEVTEHLKELYQIEESDYVIGCVSRLKEQHQILEALELIREPVVMFFVGITSVPDFDTKRVENMGHRVIYAGSVPAVDVIPYYALFDMFILASTMEGLSQSLLETMYLGVPLIATAAAGNLDLIQDQQNGLLFEDNDISALARNIERLRKDQDLRDFIVENARHTASVEYSIENTLDGYEKLFTKLIE